MRPPDGRLRVTVLDVGQGDAIVIESPDGRAILVDAGGGGARRLDAGERVVAPFLWNRGILRLAAAVTTHDDQDHAGGMASVRRLFTIHADWGDGHAPRRFGSLVVTPLNVRPVAAADRRRNDEALVVRLEYGLASFFLASDIPAATERALVASGGSLEATVLKVAHHGSRSSSADEFLRAVRPTLAIISVGARNSYGHPSSDALDRLTAAGAAIYRTDRDGAVIAETDGRTLTVTRWATGHSERYCLDPDTVC